MMIPDLTPSAQLAGYLSRFPPEIVAQAKKCLTKLRGAFPGANQIVYDYAHSVVISFTASERGYEGIVTLAVLPSGMKLYVDKSLPDPKGLLEGSGSKVRSVSLEGASDLDRADIQALLKAAKKLAGFKGGGTGRMVIKSDSKKKKAPRA